MVFSYCFSRSFVFCVGSFSRFPSAMPCLRGPRGPLLRASKMMSAMLLSLGSGPEIGRGNRATGMKTTLQNEGFFSWENEWLEEDDTFPECKMGDPFFGGGVNFRGVCLYFFKEVVSVSMSNWFSFRLVVYSWQILMCDPTANPNQPMWPRKPFFVESSNHCFQ